MVVTLHWSVLIIVGLVTMLLADGVLPDERPGESSISYWSVAIGTAALFTLSIAAHELAHALVAKRFGMRAERMTLWMLGGVTELDDEPPSPRADAWVAASGPLASAGLSLAFAALAFVVGPSLVSVALTWLALMSAIIAVFNLLPGAPLDGGRLLRAVMWRRTKDRAQATVSAARAGRTLGIVFVTLGLFLLVVGDASGIWLAVVGWFVLNNATAELFASRIERLTGLAASEVMVAAPVVLPRWWTVAAALNVITPGSAAQPAFPIVDFDGRASGAIALGDLQRVPAERAGELRVDHLRGALAVPTVPSDAPVPVVARAIARGRLAVVVDERGGPVGLIDWSVLDRAERLVSMQATRAGR